MRRTAVLTAIVTMVAAASLSDVSAQNNHSRLYQQWTRTDSALTAHYYGGKTDSAYIRRPDGRLTVKLLANFSGATIEANGNMGGVRYTSRVETDFKGTISASATYRGITAALAINPRALLGKYKDYEINVNSYGNKLGFEFVFQRAKNFNGWIRRGDEPKVSLPDNILTVRTLNINGYYALNFRRFSYPAALTQSYIQRRSAGSWMLATSFQGQYIETREQATLDNKPIKLTVANWGIGGGYGYNFVLPHRWLMHISALPTIIAVSHTRMWIDDERQSMPYRFPEVIITGRGAAVHYWKNYFAGATMIFNFTTVGDASSFEVLNSKWRIRTFIGKRL